MKYNALHDVRIDARECGSIVIPPIEAAHKLRHICQ